MSDRQKKVFVITALNGMDIEAIGTRNMRAVTDLFSNCKLKVRYVDFKKKSESKVEPDNESK
jgi:hypothetical protein